MDYKNKYLKYKEKYLILKNQYGGSKKTTFFKGISQLDFPKLNLGSNPVFNTEFNSTNNQVINPKISFSPYFKPKDISIPASLPSLPASFPAKKYFVLYGTFDNTVATLIDRVKHSFDIEENHIHKTFKKTILEPHTSIVYEPEYELKSLDDFEEYKKIIPNLNSIEKLYPGFTNYLDKLDKIDDVVLEGASAFFRENMVIIKIGFNSKKMNELRNFVYNTSPYMKSFEDIWRKKVSNPKIKEMFGTSRYYKEDETFNIIEPKLWIHTTIAALDPKTTSIQEIDAYLDKIQEAIKEQIGKTYSIDKIKLRDPEVINSVIWEKKENELRIKYFTL
jgi:hypothetical protein